MADIDLKTLIGKLNRTCRKALEDAAGLCVSQTNYNVEVEHFLLKLLDVPKTDLRQVLRFYGIQPHAVNRELTQSMEQLQRGNSRTPALSPQVVQLLQEAWVISSLQFGGETVRSSILLQALLEQETLRGWATESAPSLLRISRSALRREMPEIIVGSVEDVAAQPRTAPSAAAPTLSQPQSVPSSTPSLDQYTIDLTARAQAGQIDPIQGRDSEIRQMIDILMRRRQNNPILTGEAGVGKTAVVEGLALRVAKGDVPPPLAGVSLRLLDLGLLQAGAGVRGEFENRLKSVIAEVSSTPVPTILFIDEAHTLIGAGGSAGQGDAANLLKPALARGELRTIAATTWSEYKRYFEKDPALTRRFQVVKVDEPDASAAIAMLRSLVATLEAHHQVHILDAAVRDAVVLSQRYIAERYLPDKAIGVLDTACARVAVAQHGTPPAIEDVSRRLSRLEVERGILQREQEMGADHRERLSGLEAEQSEAQALARELTARWERERELVERIQTQHADLVGRRTTDLEHDAEGLRLHGELQRLEGELETLQDNDPMVPLWVDAHAIADVVSGWTGIPVGQMHTDDIDAVMTLQSRLAERLIGQPQALDAISKRIRTSRANLDDPSKPAGVFLLVGPSGVGKTETAISLADLLYGGARNLVVVNMSEYQEAHTVSGLKGAPPGYVGYGQGGVLTEAVRRNPYCAILLDEVEKAHADVLELFYQVFDKGTLEDSEGVSVDFKHTLILLTSNVGSALIQEHCHGGRRPDPDALVQTVRQELLTVFKPAFLGRLVVVPYYPLTDSDIRQIVRLKLEVIRQRFETHHRAALTYDETLIAAIASRCTEVDSGARNVDHMLTHTLLPELAAQILERMAQGEGAPVHRVHVALAPSGALTYTLE